MMRIHTITRKTGLAIVVVTFAPRAAQDLFPLLEKEAAISVMSFSMTPVAYKYVYPIASNIYCVSARIHSWKYFSYIHTYQCTENN